MAVEQKRIKYFDTAIDVCVSAEHLIKNKYKRWNRDDLKRAVEAWIEAKEAYFK